MGMFRTLFAIVIISTGIALAQSGLVDVPTRSVAYGASSVSGTGVVGTVWIGEFDPNTVVIAISLQGTYAGELHPARLQEGDCGKGGNVQYDLNAVDGASGMSVTLTEIPFDHLRSTDLYVSVARSQQSQRNIVACAEVGLGARPLSERIGSDAPNVSDQPAPRGAQPAPDSNEPRNTATPATASYGLFPVEESRVRGQVQLTEQVDGGTRVVISLVGIDPGRRYAAALYRGDCGPDRERVIELEPVGEHSDDPYASITETGLHFAEITNGDFFLYVFHSGSAERVAACGEVGVGANR